MKLLAWVAAAMLAATVPVAAQAQTSTTWTVSGSWGHDGYRRAGDFNGDGKTDIIAPYGTIAYMRLSTGSGFNFETWSIPNDDFGGNGANVLVGDFNCDGWDDLAVAQIRGVSSKWIDVKLNDQAGTFVTYSIPQSGAFVANNIGDVSMTKVGDYDGDGCKDDIASPLPSSGVLRTYKLIFTAAYPPGSTLGTFFAEEESGAGSWNGANWTFGGNFNCDSRDDMASANGNSVYMKIRNSSTDWDYYTWTAPGAWATTGYARAGDFNGDCYTDIASPKTGVGQIYMKTNTTTGGFSDSIVSVSNNWGSAGLTFVGDFDGNGNDDIASSPGNSNIYMKLF